MVRERNGRTDRRTDRQTDRLAISISIKSELTHWIGHRPLHTLLIGVIMDDPEVRP